MWEDYLSTIVEQDANLGAVISWVFKVYFILSIQYLQSNLLTDEYSILVARIFD